MEVEKCNHSFVMFQTQETAAFGSPWTQKAFLFNACFFFFFQNKIKYLVLFIIYKLNLDLN